MEKRVLGIVLAILGVIALIYAGASFINGSNGSRSVKTVLVFGILGAVFFSGGIGLIKNTNDKAT